MIDVHFWPTPNGKKVTILLEEAAIPYRVVPCNIGRGDQFKAEFLKWNPNHRMPVIVDHAPADGGAPLSVFESGAIMLYLAGKTGQFIPRDLRGRAEVQQWVVWQMANQGPKLGEYGFFHRLGDSQGDQSVGRRRYADEANRLYGVLDNRLFDRRYVAGDAYSIADMICYPWIVNPSLHGQSLDDFKYLKRWHEELAARPGVQRGMAVGSDLRLDPASLSKEDQEALRKMLYNQRAIPAPKGGLL